MDSIWLDTQAYAYISEVRMKTTHPIYIRPPFCAFVQRTETVRLASTFPKSNQAGPPHMQRQVICAGFRTRQLELRPAEPAASRETKLVFFSQEGSLHSLFTSLKLSVFHSPFQGVKKKIMQPGHLPSNHQEASLLHPIPRLLLALASLTLGNCPKPSR